MRHESSDSIAAPDPVYLPVHQTVNSAGREDYAGSETCVTCHDDLKTQLETRHAKTLSPGRSELHRKRFAANSKFYDPILKAAYRTSLKNNVPVLSVKAEGVVQEAEADFAFVSGDVGTTYVSLRRTPPLELRLSSYRHGAEWNLTPSQRFETSQIGPLGKALTAEKGESCFLCHSTALVKNGSILDLKRSILGVGCESCHGPGREHVVAAKAGKGAKGMVALAPHRIEVSERVCGQCHRSQSKVNLNDAALRRQLPRLQGPALSLSDCFIKGKVGCTTCHDPHADAESRTRPQYNAICMSCHQPAHPTQKACPKSQAGDCVSCHMPQQGVNMPTDPKFFNHWIKVWENTRMTPNRKDLIQDSAEPAA